MLFFCVCILENVNVLNMGLVWFLFMETDYPYPRSPRLYDYHSFPFLTLRVEGRGEGKSPLHEGPSKETLFTQGNPRF